MQSVRPCRCELLTPARPVRVAFFMGSDVASHMIVNRLICALRGSDVSFVLFPTRSKPSAERPPTLRRLFFVEHTLLQDFAFPYADTHGTPTPYHFNSPLGWDQLELPDVEVHPVESVNDPQFVSSLPYLGLDLAVSVRCYQKFKQPILDTLGGPGSDSLFVNLHPGLLPHYRGVNTFLRSMQDERPEAGFTLHHLDRDWDTGAVISQSRFPLDYARSVHENMLAHVTDAAGLILDLVERIIDGRQVRAYEQDHSAARYFSHPTEQELAEMSARGIEVFRASSVVDTLTDALFDAVPEPAGLRGTLTAALEEQHIPYEVPPRAAPRRPSLSAAR